MSIDFVPLESIAGGKPGLRCQFDLRREPLGSLTIILQNGNPQLTSEPYVVVGCVGILAPK